jgi:hypothetical protein
LLSLICAETSAAYKPWSIIQIGKKKKIICDHIPDQRSGAAGEPVLPSHSLYSTQMFFVLRACQMKSTLAILA